MMNRLFLDLKQAVTASCRWNRLSFGLLIGVASCSAISDSQMPVVELSAGIYRIEAEVASTLASRAEGLMHRREMPDNRGMLFVFEQPARHCMWMRNTLIPLAVAFIDDQGLILNIEEMKPETETNHCAAGRVRYALEMNAAWFSRRGLAPGVRIDGIEGAAGAR